ncbi:hypothetical protein LOD99_5950 [Oopsacas minuta]|uniref:Uncharacterized protein n=1 Tax=Oopsacas minuta TaxID=111878 RepID=A0AAV7JN91_9METZ|nr:hypothetical protein LOD99_5950 [Oopsacas minuta]
MQITTLILFIVCIQTVLSEVCRRINSCSCVYKSREKVDLSKLRGKYFIAHHHMNGTYLEYKYYPCAILADWNTKVCTKNSKASLCLKETITKVEKYYVIATQTNVEFNIISNTTHFTTSVIYTNRDIIVTVEAICTSGIERQGDTFSILSYDEKKLKFRLVTENACPIKLRHFTIENEPVLFILLVVLGGTFLLVYFIGGFLCQICVRGARGVEIIPNVSFWRETPYLFKDGFLFVFSCYSPFRSELSSVI